MYLDWTRNNPKRKALVQLRISNHKLGIKNGRFDEILRDERLSSVCRVNNIEDEINFFVMICINKYIIDCQISSIYH